MSHDPYKHLKIREEGAKEVKHVNPETWFHRWLRNMLMIVAFGFIAMTVAELLLRWVT